MDIQMWVVGGVFVLAVCYFVRRIILQIKGKKQAGCEKCGPVEKVIK